MKKPIIGIITWNHIEDRENPFKIYTKFADNFSKRIIEAGGIPIGILFPENKFIKEELDICDGFLLHGGSDIASSQVMAIKYIIDNKKPVLGICLGIQTLASYEWAINNYGNDYQKIQNYKSEDANNFLNMISNHDKVDPFNIEKIEESKHKVILDEDSRLSKIFNSNILNMPSLHNFVIKENIFENSNLFKIVGRSEEGYIEAIEGKDKDSFIIGVQFHPELEHKNIRLFEELVEYSKQ